jgi:vacuolar-type H+-ATPase subunit B/Vma2
MFSILLTLVNHGEVLRVGGLNQMTNVFESDKLKSGTKQIVMEGENLSVLIAPEVGGRIIDIQGDSQGFLHRTYPMHGST